VLSRNPDFSEADLRPLELPEEVEMLKEYKIRRPASSSSATWMATASRLPGTYSNYFPTLQQRGQELWHWDAPEDGARLRGQFEAPGSIWISTRTATPK